MMGAGSVELASNRSRRSSILSNLAPNLLSINAMADSILSTICNKVKRTSRERPSPIHGEANVGNTMRKHISVDGASVSIA